MSGASEGGDHRWRSFEEHHGSQHEMTTMILKHTRGPEKNLVSGR